MSRGLADLAKLDATAQVLALSTGRISASDLLEASLAQEKAMGRLNAVVRRDLAGARARAKLVDDRRAREGGEGLGALAGLPMTLSDGFDVEAMPAAAGDKRLLDRPGIDSVVAARLRAEGAVIWGKTDPPPLSVEGGGASRLDGATLNPWEETRVAGGAAAAVAAGVTAAEVGADIAGGLRLPASFCAVFSHKPTFGLVSLRGHAPPAPGTVAETDMQAAGPVARSARDLRLLLSVITRSPLAARSPPAALMGLKVALWLDEPGFALDPEARRPVEGLAAKLAAEGAQVEAVERLIEGEALLDAFAVLLLSTIGRPRPWSRGPARAARLLGAGRLSWAGKALASAATHAEWLKANETRVRIARSLSAVFGRFDVILCPAAPVAAFPHRRGAVEPRRIEVDGRRLAGGRLMDWAALASACGLPATTVPAGLTRSGLPVGAQLLGPRGGDAKTLAVAQAIDEQIAGYRPPPVF